MQIYSTSFPVSEELTPEVLINLVIKWNQGSPHNKITNLNWDGKSKNVKFGDGNLSLAIEEVRKHNLVAIRLHQFDENSIIWNTDIVVDFDKHIFSIKLDRETTINTVGFVPKFKPPVIVNMMLEEKFVGTDNDIPISSNPISINKDNYKVIENAICRNVTYAMPIVYVTKSWGSYPFKVRELAYRLRGVAHVLVEEDNAISAILKESCKGNNAHHGRVGIYYPGVQGKNRIISYSDNKEDGDRRINNIVSIVCSYVNQQARDKMMTWEGVQNELLRLRFESADEKKKLAENEVSQVYDNFSDELEEKERTIEELNNRIMALQAENQGLRAKYEQVSEVPLLYYGIEEEFFEGEIREQILEILNKQLFSVRKNTRKEHILQDVLAANESSGVLNEKREQIKQILKGYTKVGDSLKRELREAGFEIKKEGGHYKLIYDDDDRYLFVMAASGSDSQHGGGNLASEINGYLF